MWPPDCAVLSESSKAPSTPSIDKSGSKIKLVSSLTHRLTRFFSGIKRRVGRRGHGHGQRRLSQVPNSVMANSSPHSGNTTFAAPSYGRFSEKLTAAFSCNTNSGSTILRGGSDSELPTFQNVSSLSPCVDAPFGSRTPPGALSPLVQSPNLLHDGFPFDTIRLHLQPRSLPPNHHNLTTNTDDLTAAAAHPEGTTSSRCRNSHAQLSLMQEVLAPAVMVLDPHSTDAVSPQTRSIRSKQPFSMYENTSSPQSSHIAVTPPAFFKCLIGDHQTDCDLTPPPPPPSVLQSQPSPLQPLQFLAANPASSSGQKTECTTAVAGATREAAAAPLGDERWTAWETFSTAAAATAATTAAATASATNLKLMPARGSCSLIHFGRESTRTQHHSQPYITCTASHSGNPKQQQLFTAVKRSKLPAEDGTTCIIQSPGRTPSGGSPISICLSDHEVLQQKPVQPYDRPSVARRLAYQAPELAAAAAAAAAADVRMGAGVLEASTTSATSAEGRVRGGMQAAAALLVGETCSGGGGGGGSSYGSPFLSAMQHEATVPVAAADTAAAKAAAVKAAATSAPPELASIPVRSGQTEALPATPYNNPYNGSARQIGDDVAHATAATAETDTCSTRRGSRQMEQSPITTEQLPPPPLPPPRPAQKSPPPSAQKPPSTSPSRLLALNPAMPAAMQRPCWFLEDYTIIKRLYKGSSSAVYKALCKRSGVAVALKVYFLDKTPAAILHMIRREIEIHAAVAHPNIIMLYSAFQTDRHLVLVLEFASRGDLYGIHMAQNNRRMHERQVAAGTYSCGPHLSAVSYLHSLGYCHRDIKPENVLYTSEGHLKLADFGVSIDLSKERAVTRAGTANYMAPEVARCPLKFHPEDNKHDTDLAYGTACDIWALGVLAYELLVGFTPVNAPAPVFVDTADGDFAAVRTAAATAVPALIFPAGISKESRDFVTWALAVKPNARPSAQQMRRHPWLVGCQSSTTAAQTPVIVSLPY